MHQKTRNIDLPKMTMEAPLRNQVMIFFFYGVSMLLGLIHIFFEYLTICGGSNAATGATTMTDTVFNHRAYILAALSAQFLIIVLLGKRLRFVMLLALSAGIISLYLGWWITTYRTVASAEDLSYKQIEHFFFLGDGNILDLLILIGVLTAAILTVRELLQPDITEPHACR